MPPTQPTTRIPELLARLRAGPDEAARQSAARALGRAPVREAPEVLPALVKALHDDPSGQVRGTVADQLAKCPAELVTPALVAALQDPEEVTRISAATALTCFGNPQTLEVLLRFASTCDSDYFRCTLELMIERHGPAMLSPLCQIACDLRCDLDLRRRALGLLRWTGEVHSCAAYLDFLDATEPELQRDAEYRLVTLKAMECLPLLLPRLGRARGRIGRVLLAAVACILATNLRRRPRPRVAGEPSLARAWHSPLTSPEPPDLDLSGMMDEAGQIDLVQRLLAVVGQGSGGSNGREVLMRLVRSPLLPLIRQVWAEASDMHRAEYAYLLVMRREPGALELLAAELADPASPIRPTMALALGVLRDPDAVEPLRAARDAGTGELRVAALWALRQFGWPTGQQDFLPWLGNPDLRVRAEALAALQQCAHPGGEPALLRALQRELDDLEERFAVPGVRWCLVYFELGAADQEAYRTIAGRMVSLCSILARVGTACCLLPLFRAASVFVPSEWRISTYDMLQTVVERLGGDAVPALIQVLGEIEESTAWAAVHFLNLQSEVKAEPLLALGEQLARDDPRLERVATALAQLILGGGRFRTYPSASRPQYCANRGKCRRRSFVGRLTEEQLRRLVALPASSEFWPDVRRVAKAELEYRIDPSGP